jgi:hypothetical protein
VWAIDLQWELLQVKIEIKSCLDCAHCKVERYYTGDAFEYAQQALCNLSKRPQPEISDVGIKVENSCRIAFIDSTACKKKVKIPKWCPLAKKQKKGKK